MSRNNRPEGAVHEQLAKVKSDYMMIDLDLDGKQIERILVRRNHTLIITKKGQLYYLERGELAGVDGVLGGLYSTGARFVADVLHEEHIVTNAEYSEWRQWVRDMEQKENLARKTEQLKRLAGELSYDLVKRHE